MRGTSKDISAQGNANFIPEEMHATPLINPKHSYPFEYIDQLRVGTGLEVLHQIGAPFGEHPVRYAGISDGLGARGEGLLRPSQLPDERQGSGQDSVPDVVTVTLCVGLSC